MGFAGGWGARFRFCMGSEVGVGPLNQGKSWDEMCMMGSDVGC
jgi:hypothetical protein